MATQRLPYPVSTEPRPHAMATGPAHPAQPAAALLPVLKPRLPSAAEILPYLESIDARQWYSNAGPLVTLLEERLSRHLGVTDCVVTTANGTLGLTVSLLARGASTGSFCLMPSWTFAATPHAARAAGMIPWFLDVDARTWALHPDAVMETLPQLPAPAGAIIVVAPFGAPIDIEAWRRFENKTGICVVVDGAAAFDTMIASRIPMVISLHATKILGAGEGGFIITTDPELRARLRACTNFGFLETRTAVTPALNAKMSEYHAAVALAGLTNWRAIHARHVWVSGWYRAAIDSLEGVTLQPGYGEGWVSATTNIVVPDGSRPAVENSLLQSGIDSRKWWGEGCHAQPAFADCPRSHLPVTEELGERVLGLPHFPDMQRADVDRVMDALRAGFSSFSLQCLAEKISA